MWAFLAVATALLTSLNPLLYKRLVRDGDPVAVVWGVTLAALPLLGLFAWLLTPQLPAVDWLFVAGVAGSGLLNAAAHIANTRALKEADISLVTPLLNFSPVFTVIIAAVFLNEIPSVQGLLGVSLVLVGAYRLNRGKGGWLAPLRALALTPGVALVMLAGLLWAVTPLFEKLAIQHTYPQSPRAAAFAATAVLVALLTPPVLWARRPALAQLVRHRRVWLAAGAIAGTAPILGYTAISLGLVGYVTTLFKLSSVMTVLWAWLLLKEPGIRQRLPAAAVMVAGAILIAI
ncbi:MAG: DMT family transporter [Caldilineaceae bacterium]|nr:DMT family transporter [Caldilineaceae bacterium]